MGSRHAARGGALRGPVELAAVAASIAARSGLPLRSRPDGRAAQPRSGASPANHHGRRTHLTERRSTRTTNQQMPSPGRQPPGKSPQQLGRRFGMSPRCLPRRPADAYPNAHQATTEQHGCSLASIRVETAPAAGEDTEAPPLWDDARGAATGVATGLNQHARPQPIYQRERTSPDDRGQRE